MCGRTACTLGGPSLQEALCYKPNQSNKFVKPEWKDNSNGEGYRPSCNISPGNKTPVLLSGKHHGLQSERILQPMLWGMLPYWAKDESVLNKYKTNNCRFDSLLKSNFFKNQFLNGQRCVVVCDGFYEWQTTQKNSFKQPYFIYMPQPEGVKIEDETTWKTGFDSDKGWNGPNLVKMAAIFDKWSSQEGKEVFSYSIITLESNDNNFSSIHHRMPAILDSEESVTKWLDFESFPEMSALSLLKGTERLLWHPVSTNVNNGKNQFNDLKKPVQKKKNESTFLTSWLKSSVPKRSSDNSEGESSAAKVPKT